MSHSIAKEKSSLIQARMLKNIAQIEDVEKGKSNKPYWTMIKATLYLIKVDNFCYTACPLKIGGRKCKKRVNSNANSN